MLSARFSAVNAHKKVLLPSL